MADPVATIEKIVKIGLKIKEAVDTVRHNEEACQEIRKRALRFSAILTQLQQTGMMNDSPAMSGALEDLEESLQHALELVMACQERSTIRRLISAGDLSKRLRRVKGDILDKVMLATFAIHAHTTIVLLTIQAGGHPPPSQAEDTGEVHSADDARSELNDMENNNVLQESDASFAPLLLDTIRAFRLSELKAATNGFSDGNIIGEGANFVVYKGVLKDGNIIAIKKSRTDYSTWPHNNFNQLLLVVSKLQHKNIVKFVGWHQETEFFWVEEYVPNGSLQDIIHESSQHGWSSLFRIIDGVAQGLHYLHQQRVVHLDVKPSNILLDSDMNPVIIDFDSSVVLEDNDEMTPDFILGTPGYMAPEYLAQGIASTRNDVYAFGITLIVTVCSISRCQHRPREYLRDKHHNRWAWKAWEAGQIEEEFDPSRFDGPQLTEIKRCVQVGLLCAQSDRADRPTMAEVVQMLHGERELPIPKKPSWVRSIDW